MEENRWSVFDGEVRRRCLGGQSLVIRDLNLYDPLIRARLQVTPDL
jgi:hypothetical protein